MNRKDFLALIPSLGALPFISKHIEKTAGGIFIETPIPIVEPIKQSSGLGDNPKIQIAIIVDDILYAVADHYNVAFDNIYNEGSTSMDTYLIRESLKVEATFQTFNGSFDKPYNGNPDRSHLYNLILRSR